MSKEIEDFMRLAEKKLPDSNLEKSREIADKFAREYGNPYVVLKNGGLQVWSKFMANRCGKEYVYDTSASDGGSDNAD